MKWVDLDEDFSTICEHCIAHKIFIPDTMEYNQSNSKDIKQRVVKAFVSLTGRQIGLRLISFVTLNLILVKVLPLSTLGLFNIATGIVTFFAYFSDIGFAASLIQKKEAIDEHDIRTVFSIQTVLVGVLSLLIFLLAPLFANFYTLDDAGVFLVRILAVSFFLTSLKVLPIVKLERDLQFGPIVSVELVEAIVFNVLLIFGVYMGWGIWSFSWAALSRTVIGVTMIYTIAPIKLGLGFEKEVAKKLLNFGLPFQINSLLALLKDRLVPLVVAGIIGANGVALVTWAQNWALMPLEVMNIIIRISFPAFSRLQHDYDLLAKAVEKALFAGTVLVYPVLFGIGAILPWVVKYWVSSKVEAAIPMYYMFAGAYLWSVVSTILTNTFNAVGKIRVTLRLMIMWTVLEWVFTPILTIKYGYIGVGLASFIISFSSLFTVIIVKKLMKVKVWGSIWPALSASVLMSGVVYSFNTYLTRDSFGLVVSILVGVAVYIGTVLILAKDDFLEALRRLRGG